MRHRLPVFASALALLLVGGLLTATPASARPPAVTGSRTPEANASGWNNTDVFVQLSFNQLVNATATLSGASTGSFGVEEGRSIPGFSVTNEGITTVEWSAANGLNEESSGSFQVKIDKTAPVISPVSPFQGGKYLRTETYPTSVDCSDGASGIADCREKNNETKFRLTALGTYGREFVATDKAGNTARKLVTFEVIPKPGIDNTPPTVTLEGTNPTSTGWYRTSPDLTVLVGDTESPLIQRYATFRGTELAFDGDRAKLPAGIPDGEFVLTAAARDAAENVGGVDIPIKVDTTEPWSQYGVPADGQVFAQNASATFTFGCADIPSGVASCVGDVDGKAVTSGSALPTGTPGTHRVTVIVTDVAGNRGVSSRQYTVTATPDTTKPTLTATVGGAVTDGWHLGEAWIDVVATDAGAPASGIDHLEWFPFTGGSWTRVAVVDGKARIPVPQEGVMTPNVRAVDKAGNISTVSTLSIKRDVSAPLLSFGGVDAGESIEYGSTQTFAFGCTDDASRIASCTATLDGQAFTSGGRIDTKAGDRTLIITAKDNVGHATVQSIAFRVTGGPQPEPTTTSTSTSTPTNTPTNTPTSTPIEPTTKAVSKTTLKVSKKPTAKKGGKLTISVAEKAPQSVKGKLVIVVKKGKKTLSTTRMTLRSNTIVVPVGKLKKGAYTVTVRYTGNAWVAASSKKVTLRVR